MDQQTRQTLASLSVAYHDAIWDLVPHSIPPDDLRARFAVLNKNEQLFLAVAGYAMNTSSNGCSHFFYYGYGVLTDLVLQAYVAIGLPEYETRLRAYVQAVFGDTIAESEEQIQRILDARMEQDEESGESATEELDMFFALREDEYSLALMSWVRANHEHFRVPPTLTQILINANF